MLLLERGSKTRRRRNANQAVNANWKEDQSKIKLLRSPVVIVTFFLPCKSTEYSTCFPETHRGGRSKWNTPGHLHFLRLAWSVAGPPEEALLSSDDGPTGLDLHSTVPYHTYYAIPHLTTPRPHQLCNNLDHAAEWGEVEIGELASILGEPCLGNQLRRKRRGLNSTRR